jgi:glycerol-3-phosphate O-acyltransferase
MRQSYWIAEPAINGAMRSVESALAAVDPASSVIFVINHRSNMDYVLVTYVAATSSALSYAVGECGG